MKSINSVKKQDGSRRGIQDAVMAHITELQVNIQNVRMSTRFFDSVLNISNSAED